MLFLTQFAEIATVYNIFNSIELTLTTKRNKLAEYLTPPRASKIAWEKSLIILYITTIILIDVLFYKDSPSLKITMPIK